MKKENPHFEQLAINTSFGYISKQNRIGEGEIVTWTTALEEKGRTESEIP